MFIDAVRIMYGVDYSQTPTVKIKRVSNRLASKNINQTAVQLRKLHNEESNSCWCQANGQINIFAEQTNKKSKKSKKSSEIIINVCLLQSSTR